MYEKDTKLNKNKPKETTLIDCRSTSIFFLSLVLFLTDKFTEMKKLQNIIEYVTLIQARIAQLVAYWLVTGEVPGSNPGDGENFSVKISNWIVRI